MKAIVIPIVIGALGIKSLKRRLGKLDIRGRIETNQTTAVCSRRYFGLARNLILPIISPNQDDLSYSSRVSFTGSRNWVSRQTQSIWLNNAVQCSMDTWGNLSNLWIPCVYHLDALFRSRHLALISPLDHFNGDNARLSLNPPDTQNSRWLQSLFPSTVNKTFAKLRRTQFLARPFRLLTHYLPTRLAAQMQNYIFHAANKNYS